MTFGHSRRSKYSFASSNSQRYPSMVRSPTTATRSGSKALASSMVASRRSCRNSPEPTWTSDICTIRTVASPSRVLADQRHHYTRRGPGRERPVLRRWLPVEKPVVGRPFQAPHLDAAGLRHLLGVSESASSAVQYPPGLPQLPLDGTRRGGAGALLVGDATFGREQPPGKLSERRVRGDELLVGHLFERQAELLAPSDEPPDGVVRVPERHAPGRQEVRELRRERETACGPAHPLAVEAGRAEHLGEDG